MRKAKTGNAKAGEAGHVGHDRQPEKEATKGDVKGRSEDAVGMRRVKHDRADRVHPGPERQEGERSKGDAHHDGNEAEKEMKSEGL